MDERELLDKYRESLKVSWGYNDYRDWPIRVASIMHLFTDVMAEEFLEDLEALWSESGPARIGEMFRYPGRLFRLIDIVLFGLRRKRTSLDEQRRFTVRMLQAAQTLKAGDLFNSDGRNIMKGVVMPNRDEMQCEHAALIHKLHAAMFMYTEATLFRGHDASKSVHGPYSADNGNQIVFREYFNLRPVRLWPESMLLPVNEIATVCEYLPEADIRVDCFDHIYHKGKLQEHLVSWKAFVDGRPVRDPAELEQLTSVALAKAAQVSSLVDSWSWVEKARKYADIFWLRKAPLREARGLPQEPPAAVHERIGQGEPSETRQKCLSPREIELLIRLGV